jgi:hypothetical protein
MEMLDTITQEAQAVELGLQMEDEPQPRPQTNSQQQQAEPLGSRLLDQEMEEELQKATKSVKSYPPYSNYYILKTRRKVPEKEIQNPKETITPADKANSAGSRVAVRIVCLRLLKFDQQSLDPRRL